MKILTAALGICLLTTFLALPAFAAVLYEDQTTGQLFTKPAEGRVAVDPEKGLGIPRSALSNLYTDENGLIYTKPGEGRTRLAEPEPAATVASSEGAAESPAGNYSTQAFEDAVRHVVSEDDAAKYPKVKMGTLFYGKYSYDFQHGRDNLDGRSEGANKFDLTRGYINLRAELTPEIKARITPDITRMKDGLDKNNKGDFELRLKFGYVDFHDFLDSYPSLEVKVGQFEGPWLDYEENLWSYRMQGTMLVEREGFMNSADLGVNFQGKIPGGYGEWQADVMNGEGYHSDEPSTGQNGRYKSFGARLTLVPLPNNDYLKGLHLTGFYTAGRAGKFNGENLQRDRMIGFVGYKYQDDLFIGGEYLWTHGLDGTIVGVETLPQPKAGAVNYDGRGFSLMAWYRMPFLKPLRVMGRFDQFDHDIHATDTTVSRWVYGLSYDLGKYVTFLVDNERQIADKVLRSKGVKDQNLLETVVQWKFN